jgi:hypothetical protein
MLSHSSGEARGILLSFISVSHNWGRPPHACAFGTLRDGVGRDLCNGRYRLNGKSLPQIAADLFSVQAEISPRMAIVKKCEALNPYNRKIISGSVLKIEDDNTCLKWVEIDGPSFCTACTETVHSTRGRLGGRSRLFPIPRQENDRGNNAILIGYQQATQGIRD